MTKSIRRLPETKVIDKELMDANASISFFLVGHMSRAIEYTPIQDWDKCQMRAASCSWIMRASINYTN